MSEYYQDKIDKLESKCDRLADHLQKMQVTNRSLTDEIDRWKAKAEKMREALRLYAEGEGPFGPSTAKAALGEYERERKI